jgi:hypothetical protein
LVAVKEDVVERGVFGAAALFFLVSLVEMDAETMKAGECLEAPRIRSREKRSWKKVSEGDACRWRAINRP